jgi:hypothetical protein
VVDVLAKGSDEGMTKLPDCSVILESGIRNLPEVRLRCTCNVAALPQTYQNNIPVLFKPGSPVCKYRHDIDMDLLTN